MEQLNLLRNKCKEEKEGQVVTIYTRELLNTDSDFTFFTAESSDEYHVTQLQSRSRGRVTEKPKKLLTGLKMLF